MADPLTIISVAATAVSAVGAIAQGNQQAAAMEANADALNRQASDEARAAAMQADQVRRQGRMLRSRQISANAASGFTLEGSSLSAIQQSAADVELDALTSIYNGRLRKNTLNYQADTERYGAKNARASGYLGAAALLGGSAFFQNSAASMFSGGSGVGGASGRVLSGARGGWF